MEKRSYFILPPLQKHFFKLRNADYIEPPTDKNSASNIQFIYPPVDGAVVSIPSTGENRLVCRATHNDPTATLFWHIDNSYIQSTTDLHQVQINPTPGVHRLTIIDNSGQESAIEFIVD